MNSRVLVALSGDTNSAVAAALLKNQGYAVQGLHMQFCDETRSGGFRSRCCKSRAVDAVAQVCSKIDIPLQEVDLKDLFHDRVIDNFVHETLQYRTPNPCVHCNREVKFATLIKKASELDCSWIATAHSAQVLHDRSLGAARLVKAVDLRRDQSYFLFNLGPSVLERALLPLGAIPSTMIAKLAVELGLPTDELQLERGICFIADETRGAFVERLSTPELRHSGVVRTHDGQIIGEHSGLYQFSIGTPVGAKLSVKEGEQLLVVGFDLGTQTLVVGPPSALLRKEFLADGVSWSRPMNTLRGLRCRARVTPTHVEAPCRVTVFENLTVRVEFDDPQAPVVPGQAVVFYQEDEVLGGGWIAKDGSK